MKVTLRVIKADVGSIAGHICPLHSRYTVRTYVARHGAALLIDSSAGDGTAILMTYHHGVGHELPWNGFVAETEAAKSQGLHAAGAGSAEGCLCG